jgi:hypothetical protein
MKRVVATASSFALACAFAVTLSAQSGTAGSDPAGQSTPSTAGTSGTQSTAADAGKSITVTGCLQGSEGSYTLANATTGSAGSTEGSSTGTSGTSSAGMSATAGSSYKLQTTDNDQLKDHVGHLVAVTGSVDKSASSDSASSSSPAGDTAGTSGSTAAKTLKVESVRMVSATCPAGAR